MSQSPASSSKQSSLLSALRHTTPESLLQLLDIVPDALLVIDRAGTITMVNEQTEALFGYARSQLQGQPLAILLPDRFRAAHRVHLQHYCSAPRTRQLGAGLQLSGKRRDGSEFPLDISLRPVLIDEALHIIASMRYLTAQQRLEEELAKRLEDEQLRQMLNTILSATTENVSLFDKHGRFRFVSERTAKQLGLGQRDFLGKTWQEIGLPARFMDPFEEQRRKVMLNGQTCEDEILLTNGAETRWFEYIAKPVFDQDGEITSLVASVKDITERKQTEDMLHRLSSIVENSGEAIISRTLEGVITSWNSSAEKLFGYRAEEVIGQSVLRNFPPEHQQEVEEGLAQVAGGKIVMDHETTRVRKDGTSIPVVVTISPIRDHRGSIVGASSILRDISQQKRMIRELVDINVALEEANWARSQFISIMSHELRTPLTSIIGFSQILLDEAATINFTPRQKSNLERILKNGKHLLLLINDVLDLAKVEAGRMTVNNSLVVVKDIISSVVEETQSIALGQKLLLSYSVEENLSLTTDPLKLRQILLNLIANAVKFTPQGEVTVTATRVTAADNATACIAIAVKDTGIGITPADQERIFEAFVQLESGYSRKFGGTGLGLSIVRELTALLGGTVAMTSSPGKGSTFTITLPAEIAEHQVGQEHALPPELANQAIPRLLAPSSELTPPILNTLFAVSRNSGNVRADMNTRRNVILAVDDNPDILILIKAALEHTAFEVVGVQDPLQVVTMVHELQPCAILLDVMMPNVNGWQVLHQLKANPATASIPVVMLTVLAERTTGYVLGADEYLTKPFKNRVLLETLQRVVSSNLPSQAREPGQPQM